MSAPADIVIHQFSSDIHETLCNPKSKLNELRPTWLQVMPLLNDVFVEYGLQDKIGVALLHKHHTLKNGEALVERLYQNKSVTSVEPVSDFSHLIPHMWKISFGEKIELWPLEFWDTQFANGENSGHFKTVLEEILQNTKFLLRLATVLKETGTLEILGLQLIHRESLRLLPCLNERSSSDSRSSVIEPASHNPAGIIPVFWKMKAGRSFCEHCLDPSNDILHKEADNCECACWPDCCEDTCDNEATI